MTTAPTYTKSGNKASVAVKLEKTVFAVTPKSHELLKSAYVAYLANGRNASAQVKTRGEVRGGGRKPWRQKGTGRARFGSSRNPIWRGGGVVFGPTGGQNYTHKLSTKATRQALRQALSMAAKEGRLKVIETLYFDKTKDAVAFFTKIDATGAVLAVAAPDDDFTDKPLRNLPEVNLIDARYLNVFDIMNADAVVITQSAVKLINEWLGAANKSQAETT